MSNVCQDLATDLATVRVMRRDLQKHFVAVCCLSVGLTGRAAHTDLLGAGGQLTKHVAGDVRVGLRGEQPRGAAGEGQVGDAVAVTQLGRGSSHTQVVVVLLLVRTVNTTHERL